MTTEEKLIQLEERIAVLEKILFTPVMFCTPVVEGSLWKQMYEAAVSTTKKYSNASAEDSAAMVRAAMIRATAAWIEKWAGCDMIKTEQLMNALEHAAKQAEEGR